MTHATHLKRIAMLERLAADPDCLLRRQWPVGCYTAGVFLTKPPVVDGLRAGVWLIDTFMVVPAGPLQASEGPMFRDYTISAKGRQYLTQVKS